MENYSVEEILTYLSVYLWHRGTLMQDTDEEIIISYNTKVECRIHIDPISDDKTIVIPGYLVVRFNDQETVFNVGDEKILREFIKMFNEHLKQVREEENIKKEQSNLLAEINEELDS